jgi:hypothetical protein
MRLMGNHNRRLKQNLSHEVFTFNHFNLSSSLTANKVFIKQPLTAAKNKFSSDQIPTSPL